MRPIVAFQGLGQRDWSSLYHVPAIQEAIHWGQDVLKQYDVQLEGRPLDLVKACQEGCLTLQEHTQTSWQQAAIYAGSLAYWEQWHALHPQANPLLLGFSFGEWTAAAAAGCLDKETGFLLAVMRGIYTSQAGGSSLLVTAREGGIPVKRLRFRCKRVGGVWLANLNSSTQALISGNSSQLPEIEAVIKEHYPGLRANSFAVGGAFHTPLMAKAREQLARFMKQKNIEWREPELPLLLNATREVTRDPHRIKSMLLRQLSARLNFKKLAEELDEDAHIHELCLGRPIVTPLLRQTHSFLRGTQGVRLVASPFPA